MHAKIWGYPCHSILSAHIRIPACPDDPHAGPWRRYDIDRLDVGAKLKPGWPRTTLPRDLTDSPIHSVWYVVKQTDNWAFDVSRLWRDLCRFDSLCSARSSVRISPHTQLNLLNRYSLNSTQAGRNWRSNKFLLFTLIFPFILSSMYWVLKVTELVVTMRNYLINRALRLSYDMVTTYIALFSAILLLNVSTFCSV